MDYPTYICECGAFHVLDIHDESPDIKCECGRTLSLYIEAHWDVSLIDQTPPNRETYDD